MTSFGHNLLDGILLYRFIIPLKGIGTTPLPFSPLHHIGILKFLADMLANFDDACCQFRSGIVRVRPIHRIEPKESPFFESGAAG